MSETRPIGEHLSVAPATFDDKPKVAESDWGRIAVVCGMFTQEQLSASRSLLGTF